MRFLSLIFNNITRRPTRSALTVLGVAAGVASFVTLVGMSRGVEYAWVKSLSERDTHVLVMRKGAVEILSASIKEEVASALRKVNGVQEIAAELIDLAVLTEGQTALVNGWARDEFLWKTLKLKEGRLPGANDHGGVILGAGMANVLDLGVGDRLQLYDKEFDVLGISQSTGALNNNTIYVPLWVLQELLQKQGQVTVFHLRLENSEDHHAVQATLARLNKGFVDLAFTQSSRIADDNKVLKLLRAIAWGSSAVALVTAWIVVLNTLLMAVTERRREIGIFTALGWSRARIFSLFGIEGFALSFFGGLLGVAIGAAALFGLATQSVLSGYIEARLEAVVVTEALLLAAGVGLLGSLYPIQRAVTTDPIEALRYQ